MLELSEALNIGKQLNAAVSGKTVERVLPPSKEHKFCWYNGDPAEYSALLKGKTIVSADGFGIYAELVFSDGQRLCINDGVNVRLVLSENVPKNYQLAILLDDGNALVFTVAMYGGICLHDGAYDNEYYIKSRSFISPFSPEFDEYFYRTLAASKKTLSAKAFLANEQRFPGIGNGTLQDILFKARIHPKRKISTLGDDETAFLLFAFTLS